MARKVGQVRYFLDDKGNLSSNSNISSVTGLVNGEAFKYPIVQLGVQALPGTCIAINNSETPLIIGATGIYELDIDGMATITSLCFFRSSVENLPPNVGIIVDYIYDEEA